MTEFSQLLRLNARVAGLALMGRWLSNRDVANGYDRVAPTYNDAWQCRLRPVTDRLLDQLPTGLKGTILDLGCGTGYATRKLAVRNPEAKVLGVDISRGMLFQAQDSAPTNASYVTGDMLKFLRSIANANSRMIVSTWALGYSHPSRLFRECNRALDKAGLLAFVVNYFDTLAPVFRAFQRCLLQFPDRVQRAAWPRFPQNWPDLRALLERNGLSIEWHIDGEVSIDLPNGALLPWLKQTGILAGFDAMLDLSGDVADCFEAAWNQERRGIVHHYAAVVARNT